MQRQFVRTMIVAAFSAVAGHMAWSIFGPYREPDERTIGGDVEMLCSPDPTAMNLYLRRTLFLPQRPRSAWIQVLGRDELQLLINGTSLRPALDPGRPVAILADIAPYLRAGKNVLGIISRKRSAGNAPAVAVDGAYHIGRHEHRLGTDGLWRSCTHYDRGATPWFATGFNDGHWNVAERRSDRIIARPPFPVRALSETAKGRWITPDDPTASDVQMRFEFIVPETVDEAWLRLRSNAPYRMAVNGLVIDVHEDQLATSRSPPPTQWMYDITSLVHRGRNVVSIAVTTRRPPPRVLVDLECRGRSGERYGFPSDKRWQWRESGSALQAGWTNTGDSTSTWRSCHVEDGDLGLPPWEAPRRAASWSLPAGVKARHLLYEVGIIVGFALAVFTLCGLVGRFLLGVCKSRNVRSVSPAVLALVVPTVILLVAVLAVFDPRVPRQAVYRPIWLYGAFGLVLLQWLFLIPVVRWRSRRDGAIRPGTIARRPAYLAMAATTALVVIGGYLRIDTMSVDELSPDEINVYRQTMGLLARGFPSIVVHEDLPTVYTATSELVYFGAALATRFFDDERLIVRSPTVFWGTLTILLIFLVGKRLFKPWVGVTAAAFYALSPLCIEMSHIARYYSQLQFFVLLTVYFFYRTIEPRGPLNRRMLCLTVICFVCMFLSWEGSALIAPGLAAAALIHRRNRLRTLFCDPAVWLGFAFIVAVVIAQGSYRTCMQTLRMLYGSGATDVTLTPMWAYPGFDPWYYVRLASWSGDALLPILALGAAVIIAARHPMREPVRFLLVIFLGAAFVHAIVLPVTAKRYTYGFLPMFALLAAVAVGVLADRLVSGTLNNRNIVQRVYGRGVAACVVLGFTVMSCSWLVDMSELRAWRGAGSDPNLLRVPEHERASEYVRARIQPGDVVIANVPHATDRFLRRRTDYWIQTQLHLQATLDDERSAPLHRLTGTPMISDNTQLEEVFNRHQRIWFISFPSFHGITNSAAGSAYIRDHMDVVYEGFGCVVFFRGNQHRPSVLRERIAGAQQRAGKPIIP